MIVKGIVALLTLFGVPELLGLLFLKFNEKEKNNFILAFIIGYLFIFAICQLITVPFIYLELSLTNLVLTLVSIFGIISIISIVLNIKNIKNIWNNTIEYIKTMPKLLTLITMILIGLQIFAFVGFMHIDDDDSFYVGTATTAVQTNSLFKYSAATGEDDLENKLSRYRLGPFPIYSAVVSKLVDIHPAIISHVVLPAIFVPIVYMIYGLIGNELFKKDKKQVLIFVMLMSVINIWGNYSVRNNFSFFLLRIWQGKAVLANIILPAIILLFMKAENNDYSFKYCLLLFITILAGTFTTTMGIALPPIELMLLAIVYEISKINFKKLKENKEEKNNIKTRLKNIMKCLVCCIPSILYGLAFLII
ncbi:MAG: hypothetical protein IKL55_05870 [Clostridia bacterium]|nr:hypothetical protein [Clostridia bacterium]